MSLDDFYLVSSGLAAMETTLFVYDKELYRDSKTNNIIYEPIRDQFNKHVYSCDYIQFQIKIVSLIRDKNRQKHLSPSKRVFPSFQGLSAIFDNDNFQS